MNPEEEQESGETGEYYEDDYDDTVDDNRVNDLINQQANLLEDNLRKLSTGISEKGGRDSNFLHVQISTEELLTKLENFYRGRIEETDERGNRTWKDSKNDRLKTFNDFGVASMMEIVSRYIDKNTTLSSYREDRIYEIIADLGDDLILFILSNYKAMGMDTYEKKTKFRLIITTTVHVIESAYRRALDGHTLEKLNESKAVHQFDNNDSSNRPIPQKKGFFARHFS